MVTSSARALLPLVFVACGGTSPWVDAEFRTGEALVTVAEGVRPPTEVGSWTCKVAAWGTPTVALLRCVGVDTRADTLELVARLGEMSGVVEATPNLVRHR